jgi:membrane protease YdiL (CAAX protease family)
MKRAPERKIIIGVLLAFLLWYFVFLSDILYSFWYRVTGASLILGLYARSFNKGETLKSLTLREIVYGTASGALLYALFYVGFNIFRSHVSVGAENVYLFRTELPLIIPSALLLVTSFCEEYFWRGYIQDSLATNSRVQSILVTSILYALIHIATFNAPLIFTAMIAGLAWGIIYEVTGSIWMVIFSHIVWTELIFVILPLG